MLIQLDVVFDFTKAVLKRFCKQNALPETNIFAPEN